MGLYNDQDFCRQIIMENYENPKNKIDKDNIEGYLKFNNNSDSCIDNITFFIKLTDNNIIEDILFSGIGCAISTASSNIICNILKNKDVNLALIILNEYSKMIKGEPYNVDVLDDLNVFSNISKQPNRIKCSSIGSDACQKILRGEHE